MNSYKDSTIEMIEMTLELLKKNYNDGDTFIEKTSNLIEFLQNELKGLEKEYYRE